MSETLSNFLVDLASDPDRMAQFMVDPGRALNEAGLAPNERAAVLAQDPRRLAQMFDDGPPPIIEELDVPTTRRAPGRKKRKKAPKRPTRKAPKRKAPSRKKTSRKTSRKPARKRTGRR